MDKEKLLDGWNIEALREAIEKAKREEEFDLTCPGYEYILETIAGGWEGRYQAETICDFFSIPYEPDNEWIWEDIDSHAEKVSEALTERVSDLLEDGHIHLFFGHHHASGDYGLLLCRDWETSKFYEAWES